MTHKLSLAETEPRDAGRADRMFKSSAAKFFQYGLTVAAIEEFITQGVLKGSYCAWVFTLIPFAVFLAIAWHLRELLHRATAGWPGAALYYAATGGIGLATEWFIIGLSPWRDTTSPLVLIIVFHAGMFSFWGTVALAPHMLLDCRPAIAKLKRRCVGTFGVLMGATYILAISTHAREAENGLPFVATIGAVVLTFLTMNVFYVLYFRSLGRDAPLICPPMLSDPRRMNV